MSNRFVAFYEPKESEFCGYQYIHDTLLNFYFLPYVFHFKAGELQNSLIYFNNLTNPRYSFNKKNIIIDDSIINVWSRCNINTVYTTSEFKELFEDRLAKLKFKKDFLGFIDEI